jgi:tetratricopeptide (TPR) repeat protein
MKRLLFPFVVVASFVVATFAGTTMPAAARRHAEASPSPSATPVPLPTATPEPPNIAIPRLQALIRANPNDHEAMVELAGQYLGINKPDLALPLTQHLLQIGDKTAQVYFLDGYAQQAQGQIGTAINDLEQASTIDPTNVAVLGDLSDLYLSVNHPADAERVANRAVTFNKDNPQAYLSLGSVYSAESHYEDARLQFEKAFSLDKTQTKALFLIMQTYMSQSNLAMAMQTANRALAVDPQSVDALMARADIYARQHDDAHALVAYDDAAVAAPTDEQKVAIIVTKAQYLSSEHKSDQAGAIYQQLLAQYPDVAMTYVAYGSYLAVERHQVQQGVAQWQKALALDPDSEDALRDLGEYELQRSHPHEAVTYLKHLSDVAPSADGYELLGLAYNELHEFTLQRQACSVSFSLKRSPETLACIAGSDYELHRYKESAQIFDVLDSAAPGYLDQSLQMLLVAAKAYTSNHERGKALDAYHRALALTRHGSKAYKAVQQLIAGLNRTH